MKASSKTGAQGEDIACKHLKRNGYRIIERNFRKPWGEIDIVARTPDGCLVFVEVKTVRKTSPESLMPEDQMTAAKLKKTRRAASLYACSGSTIIRRAGWRIDLVAVTIENDTPSITHYENI